MFRSSGESPYMGQSNRRDSHEGKDLQRLDRKEFIPSLEDGGKGAVRAEIKWMQQSPLPWIFYQSNYSSI